MMVRSSVSLLATQSTAGSAGLNCRSRGLDRPCAALATVSMWYCSPTAGAHSGATWWMSSSLISVPARVNESATKAGEEKLSCKSTRTLHKIVVSYSGAVAETACRSSLVRTALVTSDSVNSSDVPASRISSGVTSVKACTKLVPNDSADSNESTWLTSSVHVISSSTEVVCNLRNSLNAKRLLLIPVICTDVTGTSARAADATRICSLRISHAKQPVPELYSDGSPSSPETAIETLCRSSTLPSGTFWSFIASTKPLRDTAPWITVVVATCEQLCPVPPQTPHTSTTHSGHSSSPGSQSAAAGHSAP